MAVDRLARKLVNFGLTREEAEIYIFLTQTGPTTASIVARQFEINRMRSYRTLDALEEKGLAVKIMGRPLRFQAAPLPEVLDKHLQDERQRLSKLEESESEAIEEWRQLAQGSVQPVEEPRFRIFQGRQQVYDLFAQMCNRTDKEIRLVTTMRDLIRLSLWGIDDRLRDLSSRGGRVQILTHISGEDIDEMERYLEFVEARHIDLPSSIRVVIVDEDETLTTVAMDDSMSMTTQSDTGIWTNASSYVTAMSIFYDSVWSLAPEAGSYIQYLKTGSAPRQIRTFTTIEEYAKKFRSMLESSETKIDIMTRRVSDLPTSLGYLQPFADRGVDIRLLIPVDVYTMDEVGDVSKKIRVLHNPNETELVLLLVDDREVLLNISLVNATGQMIWSNTGAYVGTIIQVFEEYWKRGEPLQDKIDDLILYKSLSETTENVRETIEEMGWSAEVPGVHTNAEGESYRFSLSIKPANFPDKPVFIEIIRGRDAFSKIIEYSTVISKIRPAKLVLFSLIPFREEELQLAELYGIQLVHAPTEKELMIRLIEIDDSR
jgi:sugar-specific transcriptional regulator TrmB